MHFSWTTVFLEELQQNSQCTAITEKELAMKDYPSATSWKHRVFAVQILLFSSLRKVLASKNIINSTESKLLSTVHNWNLLLPPAGLKIIAPLSQYKQQTELKASHFAVQSMSAKRIVNIMRIFCKNKVSPFLLGRKRTLKSSTVTSITLLH